MLKPTAAIASAVESAARVIVTGPWAMKTSAT
jgi:hypothetical protein